ncbi:DNA-methyltransferase [Mycoplasma corogypsi]|uniref:DNA-methyltransferase n=1 Tax=Mycoplasma corogypsi TaxID=2106 RepID=UPI003873A735
MTKKKSAKNKTIDLDINEGKKYLDKCIKAQNITTLDSVLNKTINDDTFLVLDKLPDKCVDLLIVDPPYNLTKNYHGNTFSKKKEESYEEYTRNWMQKVRRVLKDEASIYVCCDWQSSIIISKVLSEFFVIQNRITWQREKGRGSMNNWKNGMEDIWFASVGQKYHFNVNSVKTCKKVIAPYRIDGKPKDWIQTEEGNFRHTYPSNLWNDISIPYWSMPENTAHPTQKPEKLVAKIILASSNENDVVLDPFLGSGTTSVVAKKLNRKFIGIEQNPLYCVWSEVRLEKAENDKNIQGYSQGVFWERNTSGIQTKVNKKVKKYSKQMSLLD